MSDFLKSQWRDIAGNVKFWLITALLTGLMTLLTILTHGLRWWQQGGLVAIYCVTFVWALLATVILMRRSNTSEAPAPQEKKLPVAAGFQDVDEFYRNYDNVLLREVEDTVRKSSDQYQAGADRERYLIRVIASGFILVVFEFTWNSIYQSQVNALQALNKQPLKIEDVRPVFQRAATEHPEVYGSYSFEQWLAYLRTQILIKDHAVGLEITVRGREFLKYLIATGRSAGDRKY